MRSEGFLEGELNIWLSKYYLYSKLYSLGFLIFVSIWILIILCISCQKNPTGKNDENYTTHNYTWEIDTLYSPEAMQIYMSDIWGTNDNDVWTVGHSDHYDYQIWHWDGSVWGNINPKIPGDRPSFQEIIGFSGNDIWMVGYGIYKIINDPTLYDREYILHYDGSDWQRFQEIKAPGCLSVWGTSSDNMYFGCDSGVVLYFNGTTWVKQSTGTDAQICSIWGFDSGHVFATGYSWSTSTYYFFEKDGEDWVFCGDGNYDDYGNFIWGLDFNHFYCVAGTGIKFYKNREWIDWLNARGLNCVFGSAKNNIFAAGYKNILFHYNGETWHQYPDFEEPNRSFKGVWCNSSSVFLIMGSLDYTYMVRGYVSK